MGSNLSGLVWSMSTDLPVARLYIRPVVSVLLDGHFPPNLWPMSPPYFLHNTYAYFGRRGCTDSSETQFGCHVSRHGFRNVVSSSLLYLMKRRLISPDCTVVRIFPSNMDREINLSSLVSVVQAWYYYTHQNDKWPLKLLVRFQSLAISNSNCLFIQVTIVMVCDTVHQAMVIYSGMTSVVLLIALLITS